MNCATHNDVAAVAFCRTCGKPLCNQCTRDVRGVIYCEACLAARMDGVAPAAGFVPPVQTVYPPVGAYTPGPRPPMNSGPNPALAGILAGFFPIGVGAVYTGQYAKGLSHLVIMVLLILGSLFVLAELWRRATLRYVQDSRRRYQLMLVRRICLWSLAAIIVGFSFASELGSAVTFAGLLTAGVAVAMQSVLVSTVGYFFLIGKYGIRVGDRVQIGEVNGEVIDLGLVRMYLMEFGGRGSLAPTGRVVAFANSVVFQVTTGLFKQIPGVNFTWHELTLALPAGVDYASTKEKLTAAVIEALKDYQEEIDRQTQEIQRTTNARTGGDALPTVQLKFSPHAVEAHVRYPVHLQFAVETDERVSQALLQVIGELTPNAAADAST